MIDSIIQELGKRMGIENLSFENNILMVNIMHIGSLYFEKQIQNNEEELLIYLAKEYDVYNETIPLKVLEQCSFLKNNKLNLYGGIVNNSFILGVRLQQRDLVSGAELENIIYLLIEKIQEIE